MDDKIAKPLGGKAYGSTPHLPGSRLGPGDHRCHAGQARICTAKARDRHDRIIVTEKLDGSCVSVAKVNGEIVPLGRAGYRAISSKFEQHWLFHLWAMEHYERFDLLLADGERVVGEWLAQAHGTRYRLPHEPFVVFALFAGERRVSWDEATNRAGAQGFTLPKLIGDGSPLSIADMRRAIRVSGHGAVDPVEGAVWLIERRGEFDFAAKWVDPEKQDGKYLPELTGAQAVWHWRPDKVG